MDPASEAVDILTLARSAWDLYHACYALAGDAPSGFRHLVNQLGSLQDVLRTLRDDVNSNTSFFEQMDKARKQTLERCLTSCFATLHRLDDLLTRYHNMGIAEAKRVFWQRVNWSTQRPQIEELKSHVMVHTCNISLCMSSIDK